MQLLAGIQRPTTIFRPSAINKNVEVAVGELLTPERLALKTVKLALLLRSRQDFVIFQGLGRSHAALPTALFMLIRANRLSVSGSVVEVTLGMLRGLSDLGLGGLGKVATGEWQLETVLERLERARILKFLTEWRLAHNKLFKKQQPLEAYLALLLKRRSSNNPIGQDEPLLQRFLAERRKREEGRLLKEWRMQLWIRKFQKKQLVRKILERASSKGNVIRKRLRTAGVLHKMNSGKRLLKSWLQHTRKLAYLERKTGLMRRLSTMQSLFTKWRGRSETKFLTKKYLKQWRGRLAASRNGQRISQELMRTRLREAAFQIWRQRHHRVQALGERAQVYRRIQTDHQKRRVLVGVHKLCQVRKLLEQRVEDWISLQRKLKFLSALKREHRNGKWALRHYSQGLKYGGLLAWKRALEQSRGKKEQRVSFFQKWRQQAHSKLAMQRFFREKLLTQVARYHPSSAMWSHLNTCDSCTSYEGTSRLLTAAQCFLHWRHRTRKQRKLRGLQEEFVRKALAKKFSTWHGEALVRWSKRREPQVMRTFYFSRWRSHLQALREGEESRKVRLADYQVGREYIRTFATFKRWEQHFQVRKIEEHLCTQNLQVYTLQRKAQVLRQLRLQALASLSLKYGARRSLGRVFCRWLKRTRLVRESRKKRERRLYFERWRLMLEAGRAGKVSAVFRKRRMMGWMEKLRKLLVFRRGVWQWALDVNRSRVLTKYLHRWIRSKTGTNKQRIILKEEEQEESVVSTKPLVQIPVMDLPNTPINNKKNIMKSNAPVINIQKDNGEEDEKRKVMEWFGKEEEDVFMTPIANSKYHTL